MSTNPLADPAIRNHLLADPESLLGDGDIMRALMGAGDPARGGNVIDLRAVAMQRLGDRLARLEETHRTVVAAAYENLAGTNLIHRAILALLEPRDLAAFLAALGGPVAAALRVDAVHLILEGDGGGRIAAAGGPASLSVAAPGTASAYLGEGAVRDARRVTLRGRDGAAAPWRPDLDGPRSEACLTVDAGPNGPMGLLVLVARDPAQFASGQGTDLLAFFADAFERILGRHLE